MEKTGKITDNKKINVLANLMFASKARKNDELSETSSYKPLP
jgi:hypothetical protein